MYSKGTLVCIATFETGVSSSEEAGKSGIVKDLVWLVRPQLSEMSRFHGIVHLRGVGLLRYVFWITS